MTGEAQRIAVIGAGSWGTTLAHALAERAEVSLWARDPVLAEELATVRTNRRRLPDVVLDRRVRVSADLSAVAEAGDVVLVAVPTIGFRDVVAEMAPVLQPGAPVVSLAKGFEPGTRLRMTEVIAEVAPEHPRAVLTGPNLALEILHGHAAASVLATRDDATGAALQELLSSERFRVYRNTDVIGCELAGALKNVVAIAAGIAEGLGTGDNTKAALLTRGLAELSRLGAAMGGDPLTFSGLAGLGDLVATCASPLSRNRRVGVELGRGRPAAEVLAGTSSVAEGVAAAPVAVDLAAAHGVEVPIATQVSEVLAGRTTAVEALQALMGRRRRAEIYGRD